MLSLYNADDPLSFVKLSLTTSEKSLQSGVVCQSNVQTSECAASASAWVTTFLGLPECRLRRVAQDSSKSLSNEAPYLVVNEASIKILADVVGLTIKETIDRFRPNLVVRGIPPFLEDTAKYMFIDGFRFEVIKKCTRCEMICVNPVTGVKEPQLIVALRDFRQRERV
ncbi:MOSC domain protein, partial [Ancylostoma caninum]